MATYLVLNLIFMLAAGIFLKVHRYTKYSSALAFTFVALIILTAVFDNVIVGFSIVGYDPSKILGITVGIAPIEDFMYAALSVLIVPVLWKRFGDKHD